MALRIGARTASATAGERGNGHSIGGGPLDYNEFEQPHDGAIDDDQLAVVSGDPFRPRDSADKPTSPIQHDPWSAGSVHACVDPWSMGSVHASVACIPSAIPPPAASSSFLHEQLTSDRTRESLCVFLASQRHPRPDCRERNAD